MSPCSSTPGVIGASPTGLAAASPAHAASTDKAPRGTALLVGAPGADPLLCIPPARAVIPTGPPGARGHGATPPVPASLLPSPSWSPSWREPPAWCRVRSGREFLRRGCRCPAHLPGLDIRCPPEPFCPQVPPAGRSGGPRWAPAAPSTSRQAAWGGEPCPGLGTLRFRSWLCSLTLWSPPTFENDPQTALAGPSTFSPSESGWTRGTQ